jgi:hypothetical protein
MAISLKDKSFAASERLSGFPHPATPRGTRVCPNEKPDLLAKAGLLVLIEA